MLVLPLPAGVMILNRLPAIMTLRQAPRRPMVRYTNGVALLRTGMAPPQLPIVARAAYFLLIGWWASALVLAVAWCLVALSMFTLGLSLVPAFLLFERVPQVLTLRNDGARRDSGSGPSTAAGITLRLMPGFRGFGTGDCASAALRCGGNRMHVQIRM